MREPEQSGSQYEVEQSAEFSALMREFREASVQAAQREQVAASITRQQRVATSQREEPRLRWGAPALAAGALMMLGSAWGGWWYTHPPVHGGATQGSAHIGVTPGQPKGATVSATVSDEALLSEVQNDLSDGVPQALQPLAVSYTGVSSNTNSQARTGQEEKQ